MFKDSRSFGMKLKGTQNQGYISRIKGVAEEQHKDGYGFEMKRKNMQA